MMHTITPGKGGWLGEFYDPNMDLAEYWSKPHTYPISYKCESERCRVLALSRKDLHYHLRSNDRLASAATKTQVKDLWAKLHRSTKEGRRLMYNSMLEVAVSDGAVDPRERGLCEDFRRRHEISEEDHKA